MTYRTLPHLCRLLCALFCLGVAILSCSKAHALEGEWEIGAMPMALIMPQGDTYGGGLEVFGRYAVTDGLKINAAFAASANKFILTGDILGLYYARIGVIYSLDILEWVPSAGLHISALFSEHERHRWTKSDNGMGIDFDLMVQYRGIRNLGIGLGFTYHLVFVGRDYMTIGLSFSWFSGDF